MSFIVSIECADALEALRLLARLLSPEDVYIQRATELESAMRPRVKVCQRCRGGARGQRSRD
jgi:hypothetical protein